MQKIRKFACYEKTKQVRDIENAGVLGGEETAVLSGRLEEIELKAWGLSTHLEEMYTAALASILSRGAGKYRCLEKAHTWSIWQIEGGCLSQLRLAEQNTTDCVL